MPSDSGFTNTAGKPTAAETDAELRVLLERAAVEWEETFDALPSAIVLVDARDTVVRANRAAVSLMKKDAPVPLSALAGAEPWSAMARLIDSARGSDSPIEHETVDPSSGRAYSIVIAAKDVRRPRGGGSALVMSARDVTAERETSAQRSFLTGVWGALAEALNLEQAAAVILEHLCRYLGWEMGQLWVLSEDESRLECLNAWHWTVPGLEALHEVSCRHPLARGEGVIGRAWARGQSHLTDHFAQDAIPERSRIAKGLGIARQLALPVRSGSKVIAVVELFVRTPGELRVPMAVKEAAVAQLGSSIERYRAQTALAEHERSHALLLSNLSGMAYRLLNDPTPTMTFVSDGCRELTGYPPEALRLGRPRLTDLIHPEDREGVIASCNTSMAAHRPCNNEYRIVAKSGEVKWVWDQSQGVYGPDGRLQSIEGFISDISARKKAEGNLREASTMIAMGQLVAGVAHEVRNPLFAISANIDAFEAKVGVNEHSAEIIETLRGEVDRLTSLMNDLLEYGRPVSSAQAPESLSLVVGQVMRSSMAAARRAGLDLRNHVDGALPPILGDRRRLIQVFQNLFENSIRHTPPGGFIEVDACLDGASLVCTVADSGCGFEVEHIPRLFEPFFSRRQGGVGLGLPIVQRIVHEHGGSISARNGAGRGAELEIRFPVAPRQAR